MVAFLLIVFFVLLFLGVPFVVLIPAAIIGTCLLYIPGVDFYVLVQQMVSGVRSPVLVAIPLFILAASIITSGESSNRLVRAVKASIGHLRGGLPICTNISSTLFGAVSGSTQATVAAIGQTMRPMMLDAGYSSSFTLALIINASDIAYLIPPSIGAIVYGVVANVSVGRLFLACVGPGLLISLLFSIYCVIYSKVKHIEKLPKADKRERNKALREAFWLAGFPVIVIGGIYSGLFSPTEAAAVSVAYAYLLEVVVYRSMTWDKFKGGLLTTGWITGATFILIGAGQAFSWLLSYNQIPQMILPGLVGLNPSPAKLVIIINIAYFLFCMFVSPVVAMYILVPIFAPYVASSGVDPLLLGVLVVLQGAIGSATPPFGCDIFTAQLIFRRPYFEVIREVPPFIIILLLTCVILYLVPDIALLLPRLAM